MIDGVNKLSKDIMQDIIGNKGTLNDISKWHGASLNQVNKLSRLVKFHKVCRESLEVDLFEKLQGLGVKALVLSKLADDIPGLSEILEVIDVNIKRDELAVYPKALLEKRNTIREKETEAKVYIYQLEQNEAYVNNRIKELNELKKASDKALKEFEDMSDKGKEFIMEHLGIFNSRYILKKRLDIAWQQNLKKKGIIIYDKTNYVNYIGDLETLKKDIERRIKNNNYMEYDYRRKDEWYYKYPAIPDYKYGDKVVEDISSSIKAIKSELEEFKKQKKDIYKQIKELKKISSTNYMQQAIISNTLSSKELINHTKLQNIGMRYLYKDGFVAVTEISKDRYRFDVIGYDPNDKVIIIEAKASIMDFKRDEKLINYKKFCNKIYVIVDCETYSKVDNNLYYKLKEEGIGIISVNGEDNIKIHLESNEWTLEDEIIKGIKFDIVRKLSEKYIYSLK